MDRSWNRRWRAAALALFICTHSVSVLAGKPDPGQPSQGASFIEEFAARRAALLKLDAELVMVCEREPCVLREDLDGDGKADEVLQVIHRKSFAPGVAVLSSRGMTRVLGADRSEPELAESLRALRARDLDVAWAIEAADGTDGKPGTPRVRIGASESIQLQGAGFVRVPLLGVE